MFFMPVEIGPEMILNDSGIDLNNALACRLNFTGDIGGNIDVISPEPLVAELTSNFLGETKAELTWEQQFGTLSEMLNMVCGNALKKVKCRRPYKLGIPEKITSTDLNGTAECTLIETMDSKMAILLSIHVGQ
ncbi:chemotaxis protein CheX [Desulfobacter hydrogenophilus]|uniref:Chemotaxis protein CheX n=2 Tax=Desulfobacter hydrogenophilus TaxID=2291 RepID=A0A328FG68_9BACT|nr:chemotaxis protein CheX [Desulfobacter hydrogenophilus]QBH15612.1 chemotaxis protein CheX [Desulfobacter hydrogenophilus]RAM03588.1 chemotaxis protein CheX [Desulfobacter hydrogenophilus]